MSVRPRMVMMLILLGMALASPAAVTASTVPKWHLRGLAGVNLIITVDSTMPHARAIEKEIRKSAIKILARQDIRAASAQDVVLAIDVRVHPTAPLDAADLSLVRVTVRLQEPARLKRDDSLAVPRDRRVTSWSSGQAALRMTRTLPAFVVDQTRQIVQSFTEDVSAASQPW